MADAVGVRRDVRALAWEAAEGHKLLCPEEENRECREEQNLLQLLKNGRC